MRCFLVNKASIGGRGFSWAALSPNYIDINLIKGNIVMPARGRDVSQDEVTI